MRRNKEILSSTFEHNTCGLRQSRLDEIDHRLSLDLGGSDETSHSGFWSSNLRSSFCSNRGERRRLCARRRQGRLRWSARRSSCAPPTSSGRAGSARSALHLHQWRSRLSMNPQQRAPAMSVPAAQLPSETNPLPQCQGSCGLVPARLHGASHAQSDPWLSACRA